MDAATSGTQWQSQGEMNLVSDQLARKTNGVVSGRQSRVVLAPVAGVKLAEASQPNRV